MARTSAEWNVVILQASLKERVELLRDSAQIVTNQAWNREAVKVGVQADMDRLPSLNQKVISDEET